MMDSFSHRARKRFGQNFLTDESIIHHLLRQIHALPGQRVIEIGPGRGALTDGLLASGADVRVIELDRDLIPILRSRFEADYPALVIHQADALQFDFNQLASPEKQLRIVGNLPYNISTPLIFHLLEFRDHISDMHFMLQKEVVDRMTASPGEKDWGRLGIMTQYHCQAQMLFEVPPESFDPVPKVDSAIVRLIPHRQLPHLATDAATLDQVVKLAFQQRRKTLRNALRNLFDAETLSMLGIDPVLRPENLSLADYVMLANFLHRQQTQSPASSPTP